MRVTAKSGLWTVDWTVDWTMDWTGNDHYQLSETDESDDLLMTHRGVKSLCIFIVDSKVNDRSSNLYLI